MTPGKKVSSFRDPAILVAVHLILAALAFQPAPHPGGDSAVYLSVAQSILQGTYRDIFDPAQPWHVVYPPGFPLITAAGLLAGLQPWIGLKLITVGFSAEVILLTWLYARREGRVIAMVAAGALALSPGVVTLSHWELSDVPFTAFVIAAIIAWRKAEDGTTGRIIAASLLTLAAYSVRSAGLALIVAAAVWLLSNKRWKQLAVFGAIIVPPAIAWSIYTRGQAGYFDQLLVADAYSRGSEIGPGGLVSRFFENAEAYASRFLPILMTGESQSWMVVPVVIVLVLAIHEWLSRIRSSRRTVLELFVPVYAGMILLWLPQFSGERLALPLYPFILLYAALGLVRATAGVPVTVRRAACILAPSAFLLAAIPGLKLNIESGIGCRGLYSEGNRYPCVTEGWEDFFRAAELARTMLPENSVVLSRKPAFFFAFSGHRGRLYPYTRDPAVLIDSARAIGARYIITDQIDDLAPRYLVPAVMRRPGAFCVIHTFGLERLSILAITADAERVPDGSEDPGEGYHQKTFHYCRGRAPG
jgi:hypothetical protein